jgi:hypothetical protein
MRSKPQPLAQWRKLGWLTLLAFTLKGVVTSSVIVWGLMSMAT